MQFNPYPFERLRDLLDDIVVEKEINLTIGEPKFDTPKFIQESLCDSSSYLNKYPKTLGENFLRESMIGFVKRRFNISLDFNEILPTLGTREVLFNFPNFLLLDKKNPKVAFTNPFYQIYEGSANSVNAKITYINLTKDNNFVARLDEKELLDLDLVILNYPNNPTGKDVSFDDLKWWVEKATKYNFVLLNDECYSEIYIDKKPISLLEVAKKVNNSFKNIIVVNSISKRSSAPSLRSGFIAGDRDILDLYKKYRTYLGVAQPMPLQIASSKAWEDDRHVEVFREKYKKNMLLAKEILNEYNNSTFYIWLEVDNDLKFTKELYKKTGIKVLPGSFLSRENIGDNFVRIALVEEDFIIKEALEQIKLFKETINT